MRQKIIVKAEKARNNHIGTRSAGGVTVRTQTTRRNRTIKAVNILAGCSITTLYGVDIGLKR
jgi:hypothetical protein